MPGFFKKKITTGSLLFQGTRTITTIGRALASVFGRNVVMTSGVGLASGLGTFPTDQTIAPGNAAITTGVAAISTATILALTNLTAAVQTITVFAAQPDVPRTVRIVAAKSGGTAVGDGAFLAANSRVVLVTGTNAAGQVISETIPLNDTTAVNGVKAFATITSVVLPDQVNASGDQVSIGYGPGLALIRPVASVNNIIEVARKATAATAYTIETLGGHTFAVGVVASTIASDITATATSIALAAGTGTNFPNGSQRTHCILEHLDGSVEEVIVTNRSTDTLTVVRGANGTVAKAWYAKSQFVLRQPMTITPTTITANDRFYVYYLASVV